MPDMWFVREESPLDDDEESKHWNLDNMAQGIEPFLNNEAETTKLKITLIKLSVRYDLTADTAANRKSKQDH